jgi:DNA-binding MarR family transcriptional regulator
MSIQHIARCFYTGTLRPNQRLVAIALADYADDHGRLFPSLKNIAAKTGYSRRQTQRIVQELADLGYVEILVGATWNRTPLYQLHPEALAEPDRSEDIPLPLHELIGATISAQDTPPRGDTGGAEARGDNLTPPGVTPATPGVTDAAGGVTPATQRGDTGDTLNRHGTVTEPSEETLQVIDAAVAEWQDREAVIGEATLERFTDETESDATPARARNRAWDAMTLVFEYEPEGTEQALWGAISRLAHDAAMAEDGSGDPGWEVTIRAKRLIAQWGAKSLTPPSLKKHWARYGSRLGAVTEKDEDRLKDEWEREQRRLRLQAVEDAPPQVDARGGAA